MAGLRIEGDTSGNVAEVDDDGNFRATGPKVISQAGFQAQAFEQDVGETGQSTMRQPLVSAGRHLAVGLATKLFDHQFLAAVQNTGSWRHIFTTMTMTQGAGTLLMNASSTLTTTTGCLHSTWRQFNFPGNGTVSLEIEIQFTELPLANQLVDVGFFPHVSATVAPTDGVYFRYTSAGLVGVVNFNNTEVTTGVLLNPADFTTNKVYTFKIDVSNEGIDFWRDNVLLVTQPPSNANGTPFNFGALPVSLQFRNPGTVSGSPVMQAKISSVSVTQRDMATIKPWAEQQASAALSAHYGSEGGTIGTSAIYTNSLAPGAGAAATNTTSAVSTGFGGQGAVQPTLTASTDGIMNSFQNPVGSVTQPPRTLHIRGIWISGLVTTAFTGGPVYYIFSLCWGHTAVSLATAETGSFVTATAKAPRRIVLGIQTYVVTAAVGTLGQDIMRQFNTPIVVNPGEFVAVVAKNVGTVTSAGVICLEVGYDAYFE